MPNLLVITIELTALAFLSQKVTNQLFNFLFYLTRSRPVSISLVTVIYFPGTVIHELAHLFTAEILGVKTGKLTLAPESIREPEIQAGSVMISQTDPWRRTLIGLAPLFAGILTILIINLVNPLITSQIIASRAAQPNSDFLNWPVIIIQVVTIYLIFAVSNTMWPSKTDLIGVWGPLIVTGLIILSTFLIGFRLNLTGTSLAWTTQLGTTLVTQLGLTLLLNITLWLILSLVKHKTARI